MLLKKIKLIIKLIFLLLQKIEFDVYAVIKVKIYSIEPEDFEFITMNRKHAAIPQCKNGFQWKGHAVKELAASGSI